jgi:hypothetical protein
MHLLRNRRRAHGTWLQNAPDANHGIVKTIIAFNLCCPASLMITNSIPCAFPSAPELLIQTWYRIALLWKILAVKFQTELAPSELLMTNPGLNPSLPFILFKGPKAPAPPNRRTAPARNEDRFSALRTFPGFVACKKGPAGCIRKLNGPQTAGKSHPAFVVLTNWLVKYADSPFRATACCNSKQQNELGPTRQPGFKPACLRVLF